MHQLNPIRRDVFRLELRLQRASALYQLAQAEIARLQQENAALQAEMEEGLRAVSALRDLTQEGCIVFRNPSDQLVTLYFEAMTQLGVLDENEALAEMCRRVVNQPLNK